MGLYRYGFNGKENDNEVKGEGNQQDYGMRIYDPRIGKFLSVDPLANEFAFYTPYQFAGNKPIMFIDLDGNEVSIAPINKFKWGDNIALNAINVVNNGAINIMNTGIGLFNSTAYVGYSLANKSPGAIGNEIKSEFQELGGNVAKAAVSQYTYATKTPWRQQVKETGAALLTADTWEQASTLAWGFAVAKMDFSVPAPRPGMVKAGFSMGAAEEGELLSWGELEHRAVMSDNPLSVATSTDGKTFRAVVQNIESEYGGNTWDLISDLGKQASEAKASRIEIKGIQITNDKYMKIFQQAKGKTLMGYQVEYSHKGSFGEVTLSKDLPAMKK